MCGNTCQKNTRNSEVDPFTLIIESPRTLQWNDDMRIFMDQRENKQMSSFRLSGDLSDMASSAQKSGSASGNRTSRSGRRSRSAGSILNCRFKHKVCNIQITERVKVDMRNDGYGRGIGRSGGTGSPKVLSGQESSFENSSEDLDELNKTGRNKLVRQKIVFVHSR